MNAEGSRRKAVVMRVSWSQPQPNAKTPAGIYLPASKFKEAKAELDAKTVKVNDIEYILLYVL